MRLCDWVRELILGRRVAGTIVGVTALALSACGPGHSEASVGAAEVPAAAHSASARPVPARSEPSFDWAGMQRFWDEAIRLPGIDTGPSGSRKRMIVMFDPNCPACAMQWQVLKPYLGVIRIHWVPVGYLRPDSVRKAAAILSAPDPVEALTRNEDHYDFQRESGGYLMPDSVPAAAIAAVKANTASDAFNHPIAATPTLGFEFDKGHRYWRQAGMIAASAMPMVLAELGDNPDPYARTQELIRAHERASVPR